MEINKGSIVTYQGGFYRVSNCTKNTVNLASVWGGRFYRVYHKGIKISEVTEAAAEWYERWSQSETYQCM